jgi:hypothetical protein
MKRAEINARRVNAGTVKFSDISVLPVMRPAEDRRSAYATDPAKDPSHAPGAWTLAPVPGQAVRGFATLNLALAVTALAAAAPAGLSVAHRTTA